MKIQKKKVTFKRENGLTFTYQKKTQKKTEGQNKQSKQDLRHTERSVIRASIQDGIAPKSCTIQQQEVMCGPDLKEEEVKQTGAWGKLHQSDFLSC